MHFKCPKFHTTPQSAKGSRNLKKKSCFPFCHVPTLPSSCSPFQTRSFSATLHCRLGLPRLDWTMSSLSSSSAVTKSRNGDAKVCICGLKAVLWTSWTDLNLGRRFYSCALYGRKGQRQCGFFEWVDVETCSRGREILLGLLKKQRTTEKELNSHKAS
ncbi:hypothetical protein CJ030_MR3G009547 [Morella rubra]|uniref:GRF-type domain-containing protein n=1 Tax=Morella rubra TaxID=262757 RepID=A0A6A1W455_9ROSI|nr:hypothetical protein CJ030_MR3G009547 [Morella rubra]